MTDSLWLCRSCGIVRASDVAPWCRHNDPEFKIAARRMEPLPAGHPVANEPVEKWRAEFS